EQLFETPHALHQMVAAAYLKLRTPLRQVILSCGPSHPGGLASPAAHALLDAVHAPYAPDKVLLLLDLAVPTELAE
ncbi:thioredox_DsbH domain-containing protein, partial [Haematococcus lacustris]